MLSLVLCSAGAVWVLSGMSGAGKASLLPGSSQSHSPSTCFTMHALGVSWSCTFSLTAARLLRVETTPPASLSHPVHGDGCHQLPCTSSPRSPPEHWLRSEQRVVPAFRTSAMVYSALLQVKSPFVQIADFEKFFWRFCCRRLESPGQRQ